jgi:hypothetical protein
VLEPGFWYGVALMAVMLVICSAACIVHIVHFSEVCKLLSEVCKLLMNYTTCCFLQFVGHLEGGMYRTHSLTHSVL